MLAHPMAQRIEHWPLEKLIPYARNPRTHSDAQVAQIAASVAEFGFNNPILVDTKAGIIAGHASEMYGHGIELVDGKEAPCPACNTPERFAADQAARAARRMAREEERRGAA